MQSQRIVVTLPLEEENLKALYDWGKKFDFTHVESILFLHIVKKSVSPLEFGLMESPDEKTFQDMIPTLTTFLNEESKKILPTSYQGQISFKVTSDFHPENEVIDILIEFHATLVIVATRGKIGIDALLHSSFTYQLVKHAPCDVFVVRPHKNNDFSRTA